MKNLFALTCLLALIACDCDDWNSQKCKDNIKRNCEPYKIATSPDGVTLWRVSGACPLTGSYGAYFSSRGTQYEERHGKSTYKIQVPNAE